MALQPSNRPAGSVHVLRFHGSVTAGVAIGTFPKENGEFTTGGVAGDERGVRFLFADATDLTDMQKRFPGHVYDDENPAQNAPHAPTDTVLDGLVVNANEQDIGLRTWAQNMRVDIKGLSTNIVSVDTEGCLVVLDTLTSGLGGNTGLPVLIIPFVTTDIGAQDFAAFDIQVEIRWAPHR